MAIEADIAFDRFDPTLDRYRVKAFVGDQPLLGDLWQRYTEVKSKELQATTISKDFKRVKNHIQGFPSQRLVDAAKIKRHLLDGSTAETAKKILVQLNACCEWAREMGLIQVNPFSAMARIKSSKQKQAIHPFSQDEMKLIIAGFDQHPTWNHYAPFVRFLFWSGCRTSEAVGLRWQDVSEDFSEITIRSVLVEKVRKNTKTGKIRRFPVNEQLSKLLRNLKHSDCSPADSVFVAPGGGAVDAHNFLNRIWRGILKSLPIPYRPQYNARHTFITLCLRSGVQVTEVAEWVGNSPKTIWTYYAGFIGGGMVPKFD